MAYRKEGKMKIEYRANLVAGIASLILGLICILIIPTQISEDFAETYGITSKTVPYAVAYLWVICGIILMAQSLVLKKDQIKVLNVKKELKAVEYMLVLLVYAFLFKKSFLLSTIALGIVTLAFSGDRKKIHYVIVTMVVVILYILFTKVLHVQMP